MTLAAYVAGRVAIFVANHRAKSRMTKDSWTVKSAQLKGALWSCRFGRRVAAAWGTPLSG